MSENLERVVDKLAEHKKVYKIADELAKFNWELRDIFGVSIHESTKTILFDRFTLSFVNFEYATEQFNFWKQRLVSYIADRLSKDEASKCHKKLVLTFSTSET